LYVSPNIIRLIKCKMRWAGIVARVGEMTDAYSNSVWKPEEGRSLGRPRLVWEGNIKMDLVNISR
jgi:hypothetical protein